MEPASDDWTLINRVRRDPEALAELFRRHRNYVFRICWSRLRDQGVAEELTHEVFCRLAKQRKKLFPRARFRTWLYRVTANACAEFLRRKDPASMPLDESLSDGREHADGDARLAELGRALEDLSERQRSVVVLRVLEGFDCRETARALAISEGSVKTHLHRALALLRQALSDDKLSDFTARRARR